MHSAISGKRHACSLKKLGLIIAIAAVFNILSVVKMLVVTFFCRIRFSLNRFTCEGFCARCVDPKDLKVYY